MVIKPRGQDNETQHAIVYHTIVYRLENMNLLPCFLSSFIEGEGDVDDSDFPLLISCLIAKSLSFSKCLSSFL